MRKERHSALSLSAPFPPLLLLAQVAVLATPSLVWAQDGTQPTRNERAAAPEELEPGEAEKLQQDAVGNEDATDEAPTDEEPTDPQATDEAAEENESSDDAATDDVATDNVASDEAATDAVPPAEAPPAEPDVTPPAPQDLPPVVQEPQGPASAGEPAAGVELGEAEEENLEFGAYPNPAEDQEALADQGDDRPSEVQPDRVFAEEWWTHTRPTLELHGNFRVRANLYHNFSFNRVDSPDSALWPRPLDDYYTDVNGNVHGSQTCTPDEVGTGNSDSPENAEVGCFSPTQGGADLRFRIEPTIVISDNLRVRSQIDLLGNLVMGSTAQGYSNFPAATGGGYAVSDRSGYAPISGMSNSQSSPRSGINSFQDAVEVRRAWAEYETPFGELKFGRMPDNWGLGMLYNAGDDIDGDYQSTADRIAFTTGLPSWSVYLGGSWDFQDEGATSAGFTPPGGQPYDLSQRDDVSRINLQLYRRMDPQLQALALKKGHVVVNGGLYLSYRWQRLANDVSGPSATCVNGANALDCEPGEAALGIVRRGMKIWTPDVYAELRYKKFYAALEFATHLGSFESLGILANDYREYEGWKVRQFGFAGELEQKLVEDRLKLGFYFGWASGDPDVESLVPTGAAEDQLGDTTLQTFRFHPGYRIDLIYNRNILSRVQGTYYFKPMAQYDFIRKASGMKLGGRAEAIWTRASQFMQTPGHERDMAIELDATVYFQSKDGVLNTRDDLLGGFYGMLQYGIAFPLGGMGYLDRQTSDILGVDDLRLKPAQNVRGFLGVAF